MRPVEYYLRIDDDKCRDVIELPINNLLDINGWDLKKALQLFRKSNPGLIEWLHSPIIYYEVPGFANQFCEIIEEHYSSRACYFHYASMANNNYREFLRTDIVRIKKYFYVLRPILAMEWISQGKGIVPMAFETLVSELVTEPDIKACIEKLLAEKRQGFEADYMPRIDLLNEYIEEKLQNYKAIGQEQPVGNMDIKRLNNFFLDIVNTK